MTTEVTTESVELDEAPPIVVTPSAAPAKPVAAGKKSDRKTEEETRERLPSILNTPDFKALIKEEGKSLREVIEAFGSGTPYKIRINRKDPETFRDPVTKRMFNTGGFLEQVEEAIDDQWIQQKYGGGTYALEFRVRNGEGGKLVIAGQRTIKIAGDPNLDALPQNAVAVEPVAVAAPVTTENPSIVKDMMGLMARQVDKAEERAERERASGGGRGDSEIVAMMREQLAASTRTVEGLQRELRDLGTKLANPPKPEDGFKEKLLGSMIDGESARMSGLRAQHESELRITKEHAREDLNRMRDSFDRDKQDLRNGFDRELAMARQSFETQIATLRSSQEVALQAAKSAYEVQIAAAQGSFNTQQILAQGENNRLTAEVTELRVEVKELRAKKEKGALELMGDYKKLKEAFEDGDEGDTSTIGKIAETVSSPGFFEGIGAMFGKMRGPAPSAETAAPPKEQKRQRQIVQNPQGEKFIIADGKMIPVKKKAAELQPGEEVKPPMPTVDPTVMAGMISMLEVAFANDQPPEIVAQGAKSRVPEEVLGAIRDHGVDAVLRQMAKLPSTSPLSRQDGRIWLRKLGKALVG